MVACQPTHLSKKEYVAWIKNTENGLNKVKTVGDYQVKAQYLPPQFMALLESERPIQKANWQSAVEAKSEAINFQLALSTIDRKKSVLRHNLESAAEYQDRVYYFSFEIEEQIRLISGNDTLAPKLCHFVRSFDLSPELRCLMTFDRPSDAKAPMTLVWKDDLLGMGPLRFPFDPQTIENTPELTY